jgi:hypothetical protein
VQVSFGSDRGRKWYGLPDMVIIQEAGVDYQQIQLSIGVSRSLVPYKGFVSVALFTTAQLFLTHTTRKLVRYTSSRGTLVQDVSKVS